MLKVTFHPGFQVFLGESGGLQTCSQKPWSQGEPSSSAWSSEELSDVAITPRVWTVDYSSESLWCPEWSGMLLSRATMCLQPRADSCKVFIYIHICIYTHTYIYTCIYIAYVCVYIRVCVYLYHLIQNSQGSCANFIRKNFIFTTPGPGRLSCR